jgi:hypothetical protein
LANGWHLKEVTISNGRQWLCECNQWFDDNEGDRRIERELVAVEQSTASYINVGQATSTFHNTNTNTLNFNQYQQPDNNTQHYGSQVTTKCSLEGSSPTRYKMQLRNFR